MLFSHMNDSGALYESSCIVRMVQNLQTQVAMLGTSKATGTGACFIAIWQRYPFCSSWHVLSSLPCVRIQRCGNKKSRTFNPILAGLSIPTPLRRLCFIAREYHETFVWCASRCLACEQGGRLLVPESCLFLPTLLDALAASVQRAFAACFRCHLLASLRICSIISQYHFEAA